MSAHVWEMGLTLGLSSLVPLGLGDRMDRGNEGPRVGNGAIPETVLSGPWGLGDRMDRGNEGSCVENGTIPETVLSGSLGTRGQDGQRE